MLQGSSGGAPSTRLNPKLFLLNLLHVCVFSLTPPPPHLNLLVYGVHINLSVFVIAVACILSVCLSPTLCPLKLYVLHIYMLVNSTMSVFPSLCLSKVCISQGVVKYRPINRWMQWQSVKIEKKRKIVKQKQHSKLNQLQSIFTWMSEVSKVDLINEWVPKRKLQS